MNTPAPALDRHHLAASWRSWTAHDLQRVGPAWLQWVWTLAFSAVLAGCFTLLGAALSGARFWRLDAVGLWAVWYGKNLVVCLTIAALIHLMFDAARVLMGGPERLRQLKSWQRSLFFAGIPLLGVVVGWPIGLWASGSTDLLPFILRSPVALTVTVTMALGISLAMHLNAAANTRQVLAERRATEAHLRLLQAQMEPHFLFNTLANVQALIDAEPAKARDMLAAFTDYLRASLGNLRRDAVPLAEELALAEAYLRVQCTRMEDRLRFVVEVDAALREQPLPPLLLQALVENAVLHGIEPTLEGGTVTLRARSERGQLVLEVQDDGAGPDAPRRADGGGRGSGIALANLRERLQQLHGSNARLELLHAHPGTLARLSLPLAPAQTA